jgi:hypothetical protein
MGALKPHVTAFVAKGIEALRTPDMVATIKRAFAEDGLFELMRSDELQAEARRVLQAVDAVELIPDGEELLDDNEELFQDGMWDGLSDDEEFGNILDNLHMDSQF